MGVRFRKKIKIAPGLSVNINKKSVGITAGTRGVHVSLNTKGQRTTSVGIPGTGLSYVDVKNTKSKKSSNSRKNQIVANDIVRQGALPEKYAKFDTTSWRNFRKKYSAEKLKKYTKILTFLCIILVILSLPMLFIGEGVGVLLLILDFFIFKQAKKYKINAEIQEYEAEHQNDSLGE